jgi:hypothetical protein
LDSGQTSAISLCESDVLDLSYSLNISTKYWGNYIERRFSYFREETNVYLEKVANLDINKINISLVNTHGPIYQVPSGGYEVVETDLYYKVSLRAQNEIMKDIKNSLYRIMWDANKIFNLADSNTLNAGQLGISAVLERSD